jgi:hypothetical protein
MSPPGTGPRRLLAGVCGAGVLLLVWMAYLVRVPAPDLLPAAPAPSKPVGIVDPVAIRGSLLFDLTPLFLPTDYNSSRKDYVPRPPGTAFAGFPFKKAFADSGLVLHLPPPVAVPASPAEALAGDPPGAPFIGFGRNDPRTEPLPPRGAYVEITDAGTGRPVFSQPVADARPPTSAAWKPMEFMAAVDPAGLVGPVVATVPSGSGEVDDYFARYLADTLRVGQRLAPGFYRISVGP